MLTECKESSGHNLSRFLVFFVTCSVRERKWRVRGFLCPLSLVIVLYCIVQYCTVLYCTVLYCIILYCIVGAPTDPGNPPVRGPRTLVPTYVGESGRNMLSRSLEHQAKLERKDPTSCLWKHMMETPKSPGPCPSWANTGTHSAES